MDELSFKPFRSMRANGLLVLLNNEADRIISHSPLGL